MKIIRASQFVRFQAALLPSLAIFAAALLALAPSAHAVEPGERAPGLNVRDLQGSAVGLGDVTGEAGAVIVWFAQPDSQAAADLVRSLDEAREAVAELGAGLLLVSVDSPDAVRPLAAQAGRLRFAVDPEKTTARAYGALHPSGLFARRWTYIVGPDGNVLLVDRKGGTARHGREIVKALEALQAPPPEDAQPAPEE